MNPIIDTFNQLEKLADFTPEQKSELYSNLNKAIALKMLLKASDELTEEQKSVIASQTFSTSEELSDFLSKSLSQEKLKVIARESVEDVVKSFFDKV
jgi:hypothetical protein